MAGGRVLEKIARRCAGASCSTRWTLSASWVLVWAKELMDSLPDNKCNLFCLYLYCLVFVGSSVDSLNEPAVNREHGEPPLLASSLRYYYECIHIERTCLGHAACGEFNKPRLKMRPRSQPTLVVRCFLQ